MRNALNVVGWLALVACTQRNAAPSYSAPFGNVDPIHVMRLFGACEAFLSIEPNEYELTCAQYHPAVQRHTAQSDMPKWISADEVDGAIVVLWRVHSTFDGRVDAIELRASNVAGLQHEAESILSAVNAAGKSALLASITSSAGPRIGEDSMRLAGSDVSIFRDFIGHVGNQAWPFRIRWEMNLGL
jgi:hypothetical protein